MKCPICTYRATILTGNVTNPTNYFFNMSVMSDLRLAKCHTPMSYLIHNNNERETMNLDEFKAHVLATRKASTMQAMSALSATISTPTNDKDNK